MIPGPPGGYSVPSTRTASTASSFPVLDVSPRIPRDPWMSNAL